MNPEKPRRVVTWRRVVFVVLALAALVAIVMVWRSSGETVVFTVVDAKSGQPVTNATVTVGRRWTRLPVDRLGLGISPWRFTKLRSGGNRFEVGNIPKNYHSWLGNCGAAGYSPVDLSVSDGGLLI